jgi:hypothetical protein
MASSNGKRQEITLGDDFDAVVHYGGTTIRLHPGAGVDVYTAGDVDAYTNGAVRLHPANDATVGKGVITEIIGDPEIGDVMPAGHKHAGWIYMGPDGETGEVFYAAPKDESGMSCTFTFNQATRRAESIGAKVPSQSQLDKMYRNKDKGALKDTFNVTGSNSAGWYWSSRDYFNYDAWAQRFSDGFQSNYFKLNDSSLRCVR